MAERAAAANVHLNSVILRGAPVAVRGLSKSGWSFWSSGAKTLWENEAAIAGVQVCCVMFT